MLMGWISAMLGRLTLDVFSDLAVPKCPFKDDELPLPESLGELGEIASGIDAMPLCAGFVVALVDRRIAHVIGVRGDTEGDVCCGGAVLVLAGCPEAFEGQAG